MTKIDDGGTAFPQSYRVPGASTVVGESGLSIRDYFAALAMLGFLGWPNAAEVHTTDLADDAYDFADAMLAARKATP